MAKHCENERPPLQPVLAYAAAVPPSALNRLENIALGGKAGLKMRRPGGSPQAVVAGRLDVCFGL